MIAVVNLEQLRSLVAAYQGRAQSATAPTTVTDLLRWARDQQAQRPASRSRTP